MFRRLRSTPEAPLCGEQLGVEEGPAGRAADRVVSQDDVLDAHGRIFAHPPDDGGHAALGVAVEDRLRAVAGFANMYRPLWRGRELELLGAPAELAHGVRHQVGGRIPAEPEANRLGVSVAHRDAVAVRSELEAGVDEAL